MPKILKIARILLWVFFFASFKVSGQETLFKITVDNKVGYISKTGEVVVKPKFDSGSDFQKGIAVILLGTKYGIINSRGVYLTKPVFEMIGEFKNDAAIAVLNGNRVIINRRGSVLYSGKLLSCEGYYSGNLVINTEIVEPISPRYGVYNTVAKKFIVPPVYDYISGFTNNYAIGITFRFVGREEEYTAYLISSNGNITKLKHTFSDVADLGGVLVANRHNPVIIDYRGDITGRFKEFTPKLEEKYQDGLIKGYVNGKVNRNGAFADTNGKIVYKWEEGYERGITNFSNGLAWRYDSIGCYLTNKKFENVTNTVFTDFSNFNENRALAAISENWNIIDKQGKILVELPFKVADSKNGIRNNCFLYKEKESDSLWGLANGYGEVLLKPSISEYNERGFVNGLLYCIISNKPCYINPTGKIIWSETLAKARGLVVHNRMYQGYGGYKFYESDIANTNEELKQKQAKAITAEMKFPVRKIGLTLDDSTKSSFQDGLGYTFFVSNTTAVTSYFLGPGNNIFMQAKDEKGNWRPIEGVSHPRDGTYFVPLQSNEYWQIAVPKYQGSFSTEIRMVIRVSVGNVHDYKFEALYSNPVKGTINPTQFYDRDGNIPYDWIPDIKKDN